MKDSLTRLSQQIRQVAEMAKRRSPSKDASTCLDCAHLTALQHHAHVIFLCTCVCVAQVTRTDNSLEFVSLKTVTQMQIRDLQRDRQPDILTLRHKECIHSIIWLIQGCKFRKFILTDSLLHLRFRDGKLRCKTEVSVCSGSPSEAMLWIKEVEMVESVDDQKSSFPVHLSLA